MIKMDDEYFICNVCKKEVYLNNFPELWKPYYWQLKKWNQCQWCIDKSYPSPGDAEPYIPFESESEMLKYLKEYDRIYNKFDRPWET
jgi:hypothetical protein